MEPTRRAGKWFTTNARLIRGRSAAGIPRAAELHGSTLLTVT
jgi:hypothetical protein